MKPIKWIVGGAALLGIASTFTNWMTWEGKLPKLLADLPASGMDHGGPVFIFFLALALIAALIGIIRRFGRGMAVLAMIGGLLSTFVSLLKYGDITEAAGILAKAGVASVSVAAGWYVLFFASAACMLVPIVALIKPEPKPTPATNQPAPQQWQGANPY